MQDATRRFRSYALWKFTAVGLATAMAIAFLLSRLLHAASASDGCDREYCPDDAVFQAMPLQGLLVGVLESPITFATVLAHGDFGLGGMSPLDGGAIVLDGHAYHAQLDGSLRTVAPAERTATLWVKRFRADRSIALEPVVGFDALTAQLDRKIAVPNRIHAIRIDGRFRRLSVRSVPRQSPPYKSVTEVVKEQNVFELRDVEGTLVGYRFPAYVSGINAPGYHFHLVDRERRHGGHVLDFAAGTLVAQVDTSRALTVIVPDDPLFDSADFEKQSGEGVYQRALQPGRSMPETGAIR